MRRELFGKLEDFLDSSETRNVMLVEGPRQVGKSFAVDWVLDRTEQRKITRVNLETDRLLRGEIDETKSFGEFSYVLKSRLGFDGSDRNQILYIDECQESDVLGSYVRSFKESWPHVKVLLTGSSMTKFFRDDQRVPVGRYSRLRLTTFSFSEFLQFLDQEELLEAARARRCSDFFHRQLLDKVDEYMKVGGLPQVLRAYKSCEDFLDVRRDLYLSQRDDFISKTDIVESAHYDSAIQSVANHVGSPSKYSHLGLTYDHAKRIIDSLKAWYLVREVARKGFDPNKGSYLPKRYLYDLGILKDMQSIPFQGISLSDVDNSQLRTYLGGVFENMVFMELDQAVFNKGDVSTWKRNQTSDHEVDFVVKVSEGATPIECKAAKKVTNRSFTNVSSFLRETGGKRGFLISAAPYSERMVEGKELINVPVYNAYGVIGG